MCVRFAPDDRLLSPSERAKKKQQEEEEEEVEKEKTAVKKDSYDTHYYYGVCLYWINGLCVCVCVCVCASMYSFRVWFALFGLLFVFFLGLHT